MLQYINPLHAMIDYISSFVLSQSLNVKERNEIHFQHSKFTYIIAKKTKKSKY